MTFFYSVSYVYARDDLRQLINIYTAPATRRIVAMMSPKTTYVPTFPVRSVVEPVIDAPAMLFTTSVRPVLVIVTEKKI